MSSAELGLRYLNDFPIESSIKIADEVQQLFNKAELKYQGLAEKNTDWWKTIAELRTFIEG
jgi:cell division septum initiation protein DivIVA